MELPRKKASYDDYIGKIMEMSYSSEPAQTKIEVSKLIDTATDFVKAVLDERNVRGCSLFGEFTDSYESDFKIVDTYIEKIDSGLLLVYSRLSLAQFRNDDQCLEIEQKLSFLENNLIHQLDKRRKKRRHILIMAVIVFAIVSLLVFLIILL